MMGRKKELNKTFDLKVCPEFISFELYYFIIFTSKEDSLLERDAVVFYLDMPRLISSICINYTDNRYIPLRIHDTLCGLYQSEI